MSIQLLDSHVINQISAGEVVERPAAVVKELVENSLDAKARNITIEVQGGGLELIRVTDDGCGMNSNDLALSVVRHATSKLVHIDDLMTLVSLGFRGEALPSIAAVSNMTIQSRPTGEKFGHIVVVRDGQLTAVKPIGMPPGTMVEVRDLFANTPARLKFMKSPNVEAQRVAHATECLALSHPGVRFQLWIDGASVLQTGGTNELLDVAVAVLGNDKLATLWGFKRINGSVLSMEGVLGRPVFHRNNRSWQYFFLNGRSVEHRGLSFALDEAYRTLLPDRRYPVAVVHMTMDPAEVDVNVHPAKTEVRFRDERRVVADVIQILKTQVAAMVAPGRPHAAVTDSWLPPDNVSRLPFDSAVTAPITYIPQVPYRVIGQVLASYILVEREGALVIIDQHAAHERILFEEILKREHTQAIDLAIPLTVDIGVTTRLDAEQIEALGKLGLLCEHFGGSTYLVRSIPFVYKGSFNEQIVCDLLCTLNQDRSIADAADSLAEAIACRAAIKANTRLSPGEIVELIDRLYAVDRHVACPHGRPVEVEFSKHDLFRLFHPTTR